MWLSKVVRFGVCWTLCRSRTRKVKLSCSWLHTKTSRMTATRRADSVSQLIVDEWNEFNKRIIDNEVRQWRTVLDLCVNTFSVDWNCPYQIRYGTVRALNIDEQQPYSTSQNHTKI